MKLEYKHDQDTTVMRIIGQLDAMNAPDFEAACDSLLGQGHLKLILDCQSLDYISSAGLRAIHSSLRKFKQLGGALVLSGLCEPVREVFAITGFFSIIPAYASLDEARLNLALL